MHSSLRSDMRKLCEITAWLLTRLGRVEVAIAKLFYKDKDLAEKQWSRYRMILDHIDHFSDYLLRIYMIGRREHQRLYVALHHILKSDPDALHDHPNSYCVIVLCGGYNECHLDGTKIWRGPWSIRFRSAESFHRIEAGPTTTWTLFIGFRRRRNWGFLVDGKWIRHQQHLGIEE